MRTLDKQPGHCYLHKTCRAQFEGERDIHPTGNGSTFVNATAWSSRELHIPLPNLPIVHRFTTHTTTPRGRDYTMEPTMALQSDTTLSR